MMSPTETLELTGLKDSDGLPEAKTAWSSFDLVMRAIEMMPTGDPAMYGFLAQRMLSMKMATVKVWLGPIMMMPIVPTTRMTQP